MSLTGILGEVVVHELNDIVSDGGVEDAGEADFGKDFTLIFVVEDGDGGSKHRYAL